MSRLESIKVLGYHIRATSIKISPDKITPLVDAPEPQNITQFKSFSGEWQLIITNMYEVYRCKVPITQSSNENY